MKILMVSSYLPYPLLDGGKVRLYNLLKMLSKKHEITLFCEIRPDQTEKDVEEVKKICHKVVVVKRPKAFSVKNISKSLMSFDPFLTVTHDNRKMKSLIAKELAESKYDLIHVETFYVFQNLPNSNLPVVLTEHNIEYQVYEKYAMKSSIFVKPALYYDIKKLKRKEIQSWKKATKLIAVSPKEQKIMGPGTQLVPNGVDLIKFKFIKKSASKSGRKVLFIGNFKWVQNRDSAAFIIRNVWPKMVSKNPNMRLWLVGKEIPDSLKKLGNETIVFDEHAPSETELIFQEADLLLAPIRVGGGTNFKILESMASGTPVVTSPLGNEGIMAENYSEILIAEKSEDYSNLCLKVLNDPYLYEKISRNGRLFVEKNFDWNKIASKLDSVYASAI
jgi:glycosyltransferase involved in cell wall biosynthesis